MLVKLMTRKAKEVLDIVKLPRIENLLKKYPHELSGGMRQSHDWYCFNV